MTMKNLIALSCTALLMISTSAFAKKGTETGGGGDFNEIRVNEIRADLLAWINAGGADKIELPENITPEEYVSKMYEILKPKYVVIGLVEKDSETNEELQVNVNGVPKTCRGFISRIDSRPHILCNISRFKNAGESEQYKLIHHEYAGLANIEQNEGAASDYEISSQLSSFLTNVTSKKLGIKTAPGYQDLSLTWSCDSEFSENNIAKERGRYVIKTDELKIYPQSGKLKLNNFVEYSNISPTNFLGTTIATDMIYYFSSPAPTGNSSVDITTNSKSNTVKSKCIKQNSRAVTTKELEDSQRIECKMRHLSSDLIHFADEKISLNINKLVESKSLNSYQFTAAIAGDQLLMKIGGNSEEMASIKAPLPEIGRPSRINIDFATKKYNGYPALEFSCEKVDDSH